MSVMPCDSPLDVNQQGQPSGYLTCEDGEVFKVGPASCSPPAPGHPDEGEACVGEVEGGCAFDRECTAQANGICAMTWRGGVEGAVCECQYHCFTDQDCGAGQVCYCSRSGAGTCVDAGCTATDSCDRGACRLSWWTDGCEISESFHCPSPEDLCQVNEDCAGDTCAVSPGSSNWSCNSIMCAVGRPTIVEGELLSAPFISGEGWVTPGLDLSEALDELSELEREALLRHWSQLASLEHSSVASFARATLALMSLGAPAQLLLETQEAAADEVRHAQEVYSWLSALQGEAVRPGAFPSASLSLSADRREVIVSLVQEACLGETLGVAEVSHARSLACKLQGPARITAHLAQVEEDETRHASLAWRTLAWLLRDAPETLLNEVAERFELGLYKLLEAPMRSTFGTNERTLNAFGVLSPSQTLAARREGVKQVLTPALVHLLGAPRAMRCARLVSRQAA